MNEKRRVAKICHKLLLAAGEEGRTLTSRELTDDVIDICMEIPKDEDFGLMMYEIEEICIDEHAKF